MTKYRKKPIVIDAWKWEGIIHTLPECMIDQVMFERGAGGALTLTVPTLGGDIRASKGDYIIKGTKGELYPCDGDIFEETYDKVDDDK